MENCGLKVFDVMCFLVMKVYMEVICVSKMGIECILIGYVGYFEVEGIMG